MRLNKFVFLSKNMLLGFIFLALKGAQEMLIFVPPFVCLSVRPYVVCQELSIFIFLAHLREH